MKYSKISPVPDKVIIGLDGWLFYAAEGALDSYRCNNLFTERDLIMIKMSMEARNNWLKERGIEYYLVFVPEKQTIYPEFMPRSIKRQGKYSKLDQVVYYLRNYSNVKVVDLREGLSRHKRKRRLYDKLGTHWNDYGAFIGYRQLIKQIAKKFSMIHPFEETDFYIKYETAKGINLASHLGAQKSFFVEDMIKLVFKGKRRFQLLEGNLERERFTPFVLTQIRNENLPRLVMFRDSYATQMIPFLSEHFSHSVYMWSFALHGDIIEREKPDIVINEIEERYLKLKYLLK